MIKCGVEIHATAKMRKGYTYTHKVCGGKVLGADMLDKSRNALITKFLDKRASEDERVDAVWRDPVTKHFIDTEGRSNIMHELDAYKIDRPVFARMHFRKKAKKSLS